MAATLPYAGPVIPDFDTLKNKDVVTFIIELSKYVAQRKSYGVPDDILKTVLEKNLDRVNKLAPGYMRRLFKTWNFDEWDGSSPIPNWDEEVD